MVRTDGSFPTQMFFGRIQKQNLPVLNPNAKPFCPDSLILTQDYLTGLWSESATIIERREDGRSSWVKDDQGRLFIRGMRRLKEVSSSEISKPETSSNLISVSRLTFEKDLSKGLKVKLHKLPEAVAHAASLQSVILEEEHCRRNTRVCVFYIPE